MTNESYRGFTLGLYGESGSGKTTQFGELAKHVWRTRKKRSLLNAADKGGFASIDPLIRAGVVLTNELGPEDDPWIWTADAASGKNLSDDIGLVGFDSATSISEALLTACHKSTVKIGQQNTQRFTVSQGSGGNAKSLQVSINNEAHFGVVQGFMLEHIWNSTWQTLKGRDVMWTFSVLRGEEQDRSLILGPKLAGRALTPAIPKWFNYMWRIISEPQESGAPNHSLYITEHLDLAGLGHSFGNARYPLGAKPLPDKITPASVITALDIIKEGQEEADELLRKELGL